jgi:hypothetical protein
MPSLPVTIASAACHQTSLVVNECPHAPSGGQKFPITFSQERHSLMGKRPDTP